MTNVEALKYLFAKIGGDADSVEEITTCAEMIEAVADQLAAALSDNEE